jgi:protein arginine N-methyltransferase 5
MRCYCEYNTHLHVCLTLTIDLPSQDELKKWYGESVKGCIIPTDTNLTNEKGFPDLSKLHQEFIIQLFDYDVQFIIRPSSKESTTTMTNIQLQPYLQYLLHLQTKRPLLTNEEDYTKSYFDYLQAPLQPLMDNLESATYDTFEKDPIKYSQYQKAITKALQSIPQIQEVVMMVVGAGRGPLVHACINAADLLNRKIKMLYAVEKNPNAVITLKHMVLSEKSWNGRVQIISGDMRSVNSCVDKADIMVSELLGSFGDNELSPECLDGASQLLLKKGGICIPQNYTSYIAPIMSSKLWNNVAMYKDVKHFETQYVVRLHNYHSISAAKQCFYFQHHPSNDANDPSLPNDNSRHIRIQFDPAATSSIIHGFAGYFESVLFDDVMISINPDTKSVGMFSWFPLYIPLKTPLKCNQNDAIVLEMWRCTDDKKVWYEWSAETNCGVTAIHNAGGRSQWIGL